MNTISSKEADTVRRQIRRMYHKNFIPVHSQDTTISIGDLLRPKGYENIAVDGENMPPEVMKTSKGKPISRDLVTGSLKSFSTKAEGQSVGPHKLSAAEMGISLSFKKEGQMALLLRQTTRTRLKDFVSFKQHVLESYVKKDISSRVFVVDEVLEAKQFFLQFSGEKGGDLELALDLPAGSYSPAAAAQARIKYAWQKDTGFSIDGSSGGVLAYRVSKIKLLRERLPTSYLKKVPVEVADEVLLDGLSGDDRKAIERDHGFGFVDRTTEYLLDQEIFD